MLAKRLDDLMTLTGTGNAALGRALSLDASYISRIRSGKRGIPRHMPFIQPAAAFLASRVIRDYQRKAISDAVLGGAPLPTSQKELADTLAAWLSRGDDEFHAAKSLLRKLSQAAPPPRLPAEAAEQKLPAAAPERAGETLFTYGNEGKREAVERFLTELTAMDHPAELLLFSSENMTWLTEDAAFTARWGRLMLALLQNGGAVRVIHTVRRSAEEMMAALTDWIPLYMTGAIHSFHYPFAMENGWQRTIFIARGVSAIVSSSVRGETADAPNLFTHDTTAVHGYEREFEHFFSLCRPLLATYGHAAGSSFFLALDASFRTTGDLIAAGETPSLLSMPESVAASLAARHGAEPLKKLHRRAIAARRKRLKSGRHITELLSLPSPEEVLRGGIAVPMSDLLSREPAFYTAEEWKRHLTAAMRLMKRCPSYRLLPCGELPGRVSILSEGTQFFVSGTMPPSTVFHVENPDMTAAMDRYLASLARHAVAEDTRWLEEYLEKLSV